MTAQATRLDARDANAGTKVVEALAADGVAVIENMIPTDRLGRIREEVLYLRQVAVGRPQREGRAAIGPMSALKRWHLGQLSTVFSIGAAPLARVICDNILGRRWYCSDILSMENYPSRDYILPWHVDVSNDARAALARVKVFCYLNDVSAANGAFCYAPRTHRFVQDVWRGMRDGTLPASKLHGLDDFRRYFAEFSTAIPEGVASKFQELTSDLDDRFALEAKAGTAIIFDETGIHRGGLVSQGHRSVLRYGYRRDTANYTNPLKHRITRAAARVVLPAPYRHII